MIALVAAPTNLGLRPPQPSSVPGCAKAPEALREAGLHARLVAAGAVDAGVVLPGRYVDDGDPAAGRVRNQDALIDHSRRLATRLEYLLAAGHSPLVLGGDCCLLVGAAVAVCGAVRAEVSFGSAELTASAAIREDQPLQLGSDLSAGLGPFDLRVDLGNDVPETDVRTALANGDMGFLHSFTTGSAVDGPGVRAVPDEGDV